MSKDSTKEKAFARFESMHETDVRLMDPNPTGSPASEDVRYSRAWLAQRDSAKRDAREERTLRMAIVANLVASIAAIAAIAAAVIAYLAYSATVK